MRVLRFIVVLGVVCAASRAIAQSTDSTQKPPPATDSVLLRARRLVLEGNGVAGRALLDSALTATAGTPEYANALYWRGALASTAAAAERDYRRVIVEYPFSPHAGDALLALAQLEMARGDREPAIDHLERFLLQRPNDPQRVRAGIWLGRLLLDQNQLAKGCAVLLRTRAALGDTAVETRNQVDYYAARCAGVDTVVAPPQPAGKPVRADTTPHRRPPSADTAPATAPRVPEKRDSALPNGNAARRYTVQVAAYGTRDSAEKLLVRLKARGIVARVTGTRAPFRVRVGHYATEAEANVAARGLKEKGIEGFVATTDNESAPAPVRK